MSHSNCLVHGTRYLQASSSPAGILASLGGGGGGEKNEKKGGPIGVGMMLVKICIKI